MLLRTLSVLVVAAVCALAMTQPAHSQAWPSKPIQIIVPAGAGGVSDLIARLYATALSSRLGQPVVVENRPGANGVSGVAAAAKMPPDGHSFLMGTTGTMAANVHLYKRLPVDPVEDFTPLTMIGDIPFAYVVPMESRFRTMGDLIEAARAAPGKLNYGSGTTAAVLCAELLKAQVGVDITRVPYKTAPQALTDLMAGRIDMVCESITTIISGGPHSKLRALALAQPRRTDLAPTIGTVAEAGYGEVNYASWIGFWAPAKTPKPIVTRLSDELVAVLKDPEVRKKLAAYGLNVAEATGPTALAAAQRLEIQKLEKLVKFARIEPE
jgi:tripartite-type tricarboxylate transporter receptor subunit TctC